MFGGEIHHFPITPGEVFRRDRVSKDEGEQKCVRAQAAGPPVPGPGASTMPGSPAVPATCTATGSSQEMVGGNYDYNWNR